MFGLGPIELLILAAIIVVALLYWGTGKNPRM
jgi:hypothetical protein